MSQAKTVLLCGVGGQGTILAADLLARAASAAGYVVKVSEIHGMSQRGGAVTTVVRYGEDVASMVSDFGCADALVSFETTEALRNISFLKTGGFLLVSDETITPLAVNNGTAQMPARAHERLASFGATLLPAKKLAREAGNVKCENVALLGALEYSLGFGSDIWHDVIAKRVPQKTIEANLAAYELGLAYATEHAG